MSHLNELREGVTEGTVLSLEEFCAWWRKRPPLFDDEPLNRRMYWDAAFESAFRAQVCRELSPEAVKNVDAVGQFRRPVMAWMLEVAATNLAGGMADRVSGKIASLSPAGKREFRRQNVAPEWIANAYKAGAQEPQPADFMPTSIGLTQG